jgi:DNA polymerase III delta subunit
MKQLEWKEIKSTVQCFQLEGEPELIHVIKTGFNDHFMVVHEDAYEMMLGRVEFGTREQVEQKYKIKLN